MIRNFKDVNDMVTHHREYYRHHGQFPILHRPMVIYVRGPGTVEGYQTSSVHGAHKDVLGYKVALAPSEQLVTAL